MGRIGEVGLGLGGGERRLVTYCSASGAPARRLPVDAWLLGEELRRPVAARRAVSYSARRRRGRGVWGLICGDGAGDWARSPRGIVLYETSHGRLETKRVRNRLWRAGAAGGGATGQRVSPRRASDFVGSGHQKPRKHRPIYMVMARLTIFFPKHRPVSPFFLLFYSFFRK